MGASLGRDAHLCVTLRVSPHQPSPQGTPSPGWAESLSEAGYSDTWVPRSILGASVTLCVQLSPAISPPCPVPESALPVLTALPGSSLMSGTRWCVLHLLLGILASAGQQSASWAVSGSARIYLGVYRSALRGLQPGLPACRDQEEDIDAVVCSGQQCCLSLQLKDHPHHNPEPFPFRWRDVRSEGLCSG